MLFDQLFGLLRQLHQNFWSSFLETTLLGDCDVACSSVGYCPDCGRRMTRLDGDLEVLSVLLLGQQHRKFGPGFSET